MSRAKVFIATALSGCIAMTHVVADDASWGAGYQDGRENLSESQQILRTMIARCWNVDPGSVAAAVTVQVGFRLGLDGQVDSNEIRLLRSDGDELATELAFQSVRRAILRCQFSDGGYQLPPDEYEQWKDVVITFDPSGMLLR